MSSIFVCQQCGNEFSKWLGKCTACEAWNSLVETVRFTKKPVYVRLRRGKQIQVLKFLNLLT